MCVAENNNHRPSDTLQTQPDVTSLNHREKCVRVCVQLCVCVCGPEGGGGAECEWRSTSFCESPWEKQTVLTAGENIGQVCVLVCVCACPCV